MLVEDEPDIIYIVKARLERDGFEVDAYTDPNWRCRILKMDYMGC
jgi:DNA-binding response OmpR family regulator